MNNKLRLPLFIITSMLLIAVKAFPQSETPYKVVDTGQKTFYDNKDKISKPDMGSSFYGQDAQFNGYQPDYTDNGDGTVTDNVTGLMWQKSPDFNADGKIDYSDKKSYADALAAADTFSLAGYNDWRLPSIKELYSLIMFYGVDPSGYQGTNTGMLTPFINTDYFDFGYGDVNAGERIIDAQFATMTKYVSTTMNGNETMFGVNFADGRIKGYPIGPMPGQNEDKQFYVFYVRGNENYGKNSYKDNSDGTITDEATGLMWQKSDNGEGLNWEEALAWVKQKNTEKSNGYSDWRLPNVKELQSIVDYTRSPATTNSAAIDPMFESSEITDEGGNPDYPFYWSGTTHANMVNGSNAAYVCFGKALGFMEVPPNSGNYQLLDVHGAGAQRSDPKTGNPADWPHGHGPQGDVIRIYNYVRLVRDADTSPNDVDQSEQSNETGFNLEQNYPNPFTEKTTINYSISFPCKVKIVVYDMFGIRIATLVDDIQQAGTYSVPFVFQNSEESCGVYFCKLQAGSQTETIIMNNIK